MELNYKKSIKNKVEKFDSNGAPQLLIENINNIQNANNNMTNKNNYQQQNKPPIIYQNFMLSSFNYYMMNPQQ